VHVPKDAPWLEEFLDQFTAFPAGKHDDLVDSSSQALSYMIFSNGQAGLPYTEEQKALEESIVQEQQVFLSPSMYNVYDNTDGFW
jgi:hypothetical protein